MLGAQDRAEACGKNTSFNSLFEMPRRGSATGTAERGGQILSILYLRCPPCKPNSAWSKASMYFQFSIWDATTAERRRGASPRWWAFNSLFEMPVCFLPYGKHNSGNNFQFSIWDAVPAVRREPVPGTHPFNSLFEMLPSAMLIDIAECIMLSILYLRCGIPSNNIYISYHGSFQFSIWDALPSCWTLTQFPSYTATFNSLFEMLKSIGISNVEELTKISFNSLFEMLEYRSCVDVDADKLLSILYLRCFLLVELIFRFGLSFLSILYLRCWLQCICRVTTWIHLSILYLRCLDFGLGFHRVKNTLSILYLRCN